MADEAPKVGLRGAVAAAGAKMAEMKMAMPDVQGALYANHDWKHPTMWGWICYGIVLIIIVVIIWAVCCGSKKSEQAWAGIKFAEKQDSDVVSGGKNQKTYKHPTYGNREWRGARVRDTDMSHPSHQSATKKLLKNDDVIAVTVNGQKTNLVSTVRGQSRDTIKDIIGKYPVGTVMKFTVERPATQGGSTQFDYTFTLASREGAKAAAYGSMM